MTVNVEREMVRQALFKATQQLGPAEPVDRPHLSVGQRRSRRGPSQAEGLLQFVEGQDGLIIAREAPPLDLAGRRGRSRNEAILFEHSFERLIPFQTDEDVPSTSLTSRPTGRRGVVASGIDLGRSTVATALDRLDRTLNKFLDDSPKKSRPFHELKQNDGLIHRAPLDKIRNNGRILLLVHGTFSHSDSFVNQWQDAEGKKFIAKLFPRYQQVITYDHRTVGLDPLLNAHELHKTLRQATEAQIDIICHSRGGLVTRAWLEGLDGGDPQKRRAVFVGSTLAGTSLASPHRLRSCISCLSSYAGALAKGSKLASLAVPFFATAATLFQIVSSVTGLAGKTPALDLAIALIPGVAAQSRVDSNHLLRSLRQAALDPRGRYFFVTSDFQPAGPTWKFWEYFRLSQLAFGGAKALVDPIFAGANDLVVDTTSMTDLGEGTTLKVPVSQICDFGANGEVHHINYFEQTKTQQFILKSLV